MAYKYLINCDLTTYESTLIIINDMNINYKKLNNYDGSYDFIITCSPDIAAELKNKNLKLIMDKPLNYVI